MMSSRAILIHHANCTLYPHDCALGVIYAKADSSDRCCVETFGSIDDDGGDGTVTCNGCAWDSCCRGVRAEPELDAMIDHPAHYGGADNPFEAIKVIEAWQLNFNLGNTVKYISRAGKKSTDRLTDLKKALWYLEREIANAKQ